MSRLPITRLVLYKHGVGYYERRSVFEGEEVAIVFQTKEMNDVLKSLTVIDRGKGQVLGLEYPTQKTREEKLKSVNIDLKDSRSLRDLITSLSGRRVRLLVGEPVRVSNFPNQAQAIPGRVLGLDEAPAGQPMGTGRISILRDNTSQVFSIEIEKIAGIDLLEERSSEDLKFYLETNAGREEECIVKVHLSPGEHDLSITYIAPAPTWRVSYRLMTEEGEKKSPARAVLLGLGIVDNQLEEDLNGVSLALVSGMPVSFVYNLYTPYIPQRPIVEEENRTLDKIETSAGGVDRFLGAIPPSPAALASAEGMLQPALKTFTQSIQETQPVHVEGKDLGELFEYSVNTPVQIARGQSAIVPILSSNPAYRKEMNYTIGQTSPHPFACIRMMNNSGMVLERGPVTVMENGLYAGEAVLPFTTRDGEVLIPYAVELGVKVQTKTDYRSEVQGLGVKAGYFIRLEWEINAIHTQIFNRTPKEITLLVEQPRRAGYDLFDSPTPKEMTLEYYRFEVKVPAHKEHALIVQERFLQRRQEDIRKQSLAVLRKYMENGLLVEGIFQQLTDLLRLWDQVTEKENERQTLQKESEIIAKNQERIRSNLQTLGSDGREGELRISYVERLQEAEVHFQEFEERDRTLRKEIEEVKASIDLRIQEMDRNIQ